MRAVVAAIAVLGLCSACASAVTPARRHVPRAGPARFVLVSSSAALDSSRRVESIDARGRVVRTIARNVYGASVLEDTGEPRTAFEVIDAKSGKTTGPALGGFYPGIGPPVWAPDSRRFAVAGGLPGNGLPAVGVFSNRGDFLSSVSLMNDPFASQVAWTRAGLYLIGRSSGSTKLLFVPTGKTVPKEIFSTHDRWPVDVQPLD